ncbi:MAG: hypothetical protein LBH69_04860 [Methanomassiliicoccaceae archaeon]|nr:hypothetical protein [Methanomassiliicoccaceae archaeon]
MSDMFGIVVCPSCDRKRIADLKDETSSCPYCSATHRIVGSQVLYSNVSQDVVRKTFKNMDSAKYLGPEARVKDPDPMSSLMYQYERAGDTRNKYRVLAYGLTKMRGSFNEDDINELFPGKGEKMIRMMIDGELIIESPDGKYVAL